MTRRPPDEGTDQDLQWRVLHLLQRRRDARRTGEPPRRVKALVLARACRIRPGGSDDSRKRGLRNVIRALRDAGVEVASDLGGYWLPVDAHDLAEYQAFLRRQGLARLAAARRSKQSSMAAETGGQLIMFVMDDSPESPAASAIAS